MREQHPQGGSSPALPPYPDADLMYVVDLLPADEQALPLLFRDGHNLDDPRFVVNVAQDAKPVVRSEADLPGGGEAGRLPQRFPVGRLGAIPGFGYRHLLPS